MNRFKHFRENGGIDHNCFINIIEGAAGQNTHLEHLEDEIFNNGVDGTRNSINFLRDLRDSLAGHASGPKNITVKFDGAPAIFAGIDPADGKFFVAKKGVFNKTPLLYKSVADVSSDAKLVPELKHLFTVAFQEFSKLGIKKGMYQGDLMFTKKDLSKETIDGETYTTFQPNTIVYAVPYNSALAKKIRNAKIGIIWHTTYTGKTLQSMSASFGKNIVTKFKKSSALWMDDANYKDVTGTATFTKSETDHLTKILSDTGIVFKQTSAAVLNLIVNDEELKSRIKTYNNTYVRAGNPFPNPSTHVSGLIKYIEDVYNKEINSKKSEKGKATWTAKKERLMGIIGNHISSFINIFRLMGLLIEAKQMVVAKLNQAGGLKTFLRTHKGFTITSQEGFVAIDNIKGTVKLVDRLEFSLANFSPNVIKGWER